MIMSRCVREKETFHFKLERDRLLKLKLKALRGGVWFKALSRIDRVLINLTMKVVHGVRSFALAKTVFTVVRKLEDALENRFLNIIKKAGFLLARKLSFFAQEWGNDSARAWAFDKSFVNFLAIMHLNSPRVFKP